MQPEDGLAGRLVRRQHQQHPIEPPGAPQRAVHVPGMVGGRQHKDTIVALRGSVELGQQRLHDAAQAAAPQIGSLMADRVNLVKKQHARGVTPGGVEDRPQLAFALSDVHVQDVDEAHRIETGTELTGYGAGDERLPAAGRSVKQQPAAKALAVEAPQLRVSHREQERIFQPLLDLLHPCHISESHTRLLDVADGRHVRVFADEHRRDDALEGLLCLRPVERICRRCVGGIGDLGDSRACGGIAGFCGVSRRWGRRLRPLGAIARGRLIGGAALGSRLAPKRGARGCQQLLGLLVSGIRANDGRRLRQCLDVLAGGEEQLRVVQS